MSLSQTLKGLHWSKVPNDNDDEVAARGILYLLIFQQLGQLVRWSWGYHVLLAPKERYLEDTDGEDSATRIEQGQECYTDNPNQTDPDEPLIRTRSSDSLTHRTAGSSGDTEEFRSGEQTPVAAQTYSYTKLPTHGQVNEESDHHPSLIGPPPSGPFLPRQSTGGHILLFPNVELPHEGHHHKKGPFARVKEYLGQRRSRIISCIASGWEKISNAVYSRLPPSVQKPLSVCARGVKRFCHGLWDFMNPPLWAMLVSIIVASVPSLQHLFFDEDTFVNSSVTRAINQNAQVAVPLILVVLGANLARNTLSQEALEDMVHPKEERKLIIASLVARMLLPTLIMAPLLALLAKHVPISILGDPIFIIVCFLLTGAPSALQLAQICQINNVYVSAMSKLLFQSYVVW
jgi:predicted permease